MKSITTLGKRNKKKLRIFFQIGQQSPATAMNVNTNQEAFEICTRLKINS